ncbi:glycerophosphodiester phosphodiesterase [Pedobacter yulinensis]|uniref:Glycerophosphodiester phosphodiesterase n=1 Tax=Pedobacter yulinensis TaxID=2126353 RepID=A0A2T3HQF4_9SPHI|nr:glycerophosphodiester phosphodiesterase family protein [Pedobacter yulinensis]PST84659.1 glycerophosphodiester phosphodiesterase [Pedobacter yulinensis]
MKYQLKTGLLLAALLACGQLASAQQKMHTLKIKSSKDARRFFKYEGDGTILISGHRGGMVKGFPENSIETFENTLRHTPAYYEIDPRLTKDSIPVLMHDATLERTTTGRGKLSSYTLAEVKQLQLKDPEGNITPFRVPTLEEAIVWAKGKTLINLDKKDLPMEKTAAMIDKHKAWGWVMLTVHNAEQARFYYDKSKEAIFSAHILNKKSFEAYDRSGVPWKNFMAYVGPKPTPENLEICKWLHERGVMVMIGTGPSADKLPDPEARKAGYQEVVRAGFDIIESDLPIEVAAAVRPLQPRKSKKARFFN